MSSTFIEDLNKVKNKEVLSEDLKKDAAEFFNQGIPAPNKPAEPTLKDATPDGKAPEIKVPDASPAKIKIGTQEFNSMDEAIAYANDLEQATKEQEAFERGKKAAVPEPTPEPEKDELEGIEEELFVDPKKAIKKIVEVTRNNTLKEVKKEKTEEQKAAEQAATVKKTWDDFYSKNTDLSKNQEFVQFVLQKNPDLLQIETSKALEELAKKTRAYIGSVKESSLPTKELQKEPVISPQGGNASTATKPQATEKAMDFVTQMRNLRNSKTGQG